MSNDIYDAAMARRERGETEADRIWAWLWSQNIFSTTNTNQEARCSDSTTVVTDTIHSRAVVSRNCDGAVLLQE